MLWTVLTVVAALLVPVQARLNGQLALEYGDPIAASVVSFGGGFALLVLASAARRDWRGSVPAVARALRAGRLRRWHLLGGLAGATVVAAQSFVGPLTGIALLTVAIVAGQTLGGVLVDRAGFGPAGVIRPTRDRVLGAAIVLLAVVVSVWPRLTVAAPLLALLVPLVGGIGNAAQQAVNGRIGGETTTFAATLTNFCAGTVALVSVFAVRRLSGSPDIDWFAVPWYLPLGGLVGIAVVAILARASAAIGVLQLTLWFVAGQLLGSLVLDLVAPSGTATVTWWTVAGLAVAFAGVAVAPAAAIGRRGRAGRRGGQAPSAPS